MPHAVIEGADICPDLAGKPLAREGGIVHKIVEVAEAPAGWLLKSLIVSEGEPTRFLSRIDRREDGLVVHLDDHVPVERSPLVFDHLALLAHRVLEANAGSRLGKTNLQERIERLSRAAART